MFDFSNGDYLDEPNRCAADIFTTALYIVDAYLKAGFIKREW